jgi:hypothetical protein
MDFYRLTLGILSVWRITHLLEAEDGPWNLTARLRQRVGPGFLGALLDCFACSSLWIAAPFALWLGDGYGHRLVLWLSFSAGAILLQQVAGPRHGPAPAPYFEHEE